jgi:hypothetical protein
MAFDLGISRLVGQTIDGQFKVNEALISQLTTLLTAGQEGVWDDQRAAVLAARLAAQPGNNQARAMLDFLSVYSVTRQAGGSWQTLPLLNDAANSNIVRTALFGNGTASGSAISQVLIGGKTDKLVSPQSSWYVAQNPYPNMRLVLDRLGVPHNTDPQPSLATEAGAVTYSFVNNKWVYRLQLPNGTTTHVNNHDGRVAHQSHFHIYVKVPGLQPIVGSAQNLQTSVSAEDYSTTQPLLSALQTKSSPVTLAQGDQSMFVYDIPAISSGEVVLVAQAVAPKLAQSPKIQAITLQGGWIVPSDPQYSYEPGSFAMDLAQNACSQLLQVGEFKPLRWTSPTCKIIEIVTKPRHGILIDEGNGGYGFKPTPGYLGKDSFQYVVEGADGRRVLVTMPVLLKTMAEAFSFYQLMPVEQTNTLATWQKQSELSALLASASGVVYLTSDLPGLSVAQTTGSGSSAQIVLDPTAAGHGWYVDPTPLDNSDDYLPTSNPDVWQAKAGTDAAGKMDLLSVLLHEYGHALGLEHSADSGDYMAATLQPGERRLPSADELQLMSQLVAELKGTSTGDQPPTVPNPSVPLGALLLGRLTLGRRPEDAVAQGSQALFAAHPTLQGGKLQNLQDWATQGDVSVASGGTGGATLQEASASQTRLNQVFMVGPQDRYLSFTLSDLALDDQAAGPDDALEVGLLNADTGADLTSSIGLSHTDALLNLQASGAELAAQGVSHITHADGSRTYLVDLSGIARNADGTVAVNLSFDLIGFGANGSHVNVSDVRLFGQPQTVDDSASGAEDAVLHIAALANDQNADLAGLAPVVVAAPGHGTVLANADGAFS